MGIALRMAQNEQTALYRSLLAPIAALLVVGALTRLWKATGLPAVIEADPLGSPEQAGWANALAFGANAVLIFSPAWHRYSSRARCLQRGRDLAGV